MKQQVRVGAIVATGLALLVSVLAVAPTSHASNRSKCVTTSAEQNEKSARVWMKAAVENDWATFKKLTHEELTRSWSGRQLSEAPGFDDEIALIQRLQRALSDTQVVINATVRSNNARKSTTANIPGSTNDAVVMTGEIKGNLPNGSPATIPYSTWLYFKCGKVYSSFTFPLVPPEFKASILNPGLSSRSGSVSEGKS